ncbi:MAG: hypothetical protein RL427_292 [Bacteroidota bacterium]|jgi:preprotein translocase subunit SecG
MEITYIVLCIIGIVAFNLIAFILLQNRRADKDLTNYLNKTKKRKRFGEQFGK